MLTTEERNHIPLPFNSGVFPVHVEDEPSEMQKDKGVLQWTMCQGLQTQPHKSVQERDKKWYSTAAAVH